jgi:plasmid stabilization system protein ParE
MKYVLSVGAELDLNEIWDYIAQDGAAAPDRWTAKLFTAFARWPEDRG